MFVVPTTERDTENEKSAVFSWGDRSTCLTEVPFIHRTSCEHASSDIAPRLVIVCWFVTRDFDPYGTRRPISPPGETLKK